MTTTVALIFIASGLLIFVVSLPLVYRKVPMNALYGVRIPRSMESEQRWYDINAYGGRQLARWSWLITATGAVGFFVPQEHLLVYTLAGTAAILIATLVPVVQILIWSRKHNRLA